MKNLTLIFLFIAHTGISQNAQEIYKSHLTVIEQWINLKEGESMSGNKINDASIFFEKITGHECSWVNSFEPTAQPIKEDFEIWKKWFERNKKQLYWDKDSKSVKTVPE